MEVDTALKCDTYFAKPYHSWEREDRMRMLMGYLDNIFQRVWFFVMLSLKK
jgi:IS30 family transposase